MKLRCGFCSHDRWMQPIKHYEYLPVEYFAYIDTNVLHDRPMLADESKEKNSKGG